MIDVEAGALLFVVLGLAVFVSACFYRLLQEEDDD